MKKDMKQLDRETDRNNILYSLSSRAISCDKAEELINALHKAPEAKDVFAKRSKLMKPSF